MSSEASSEICGMVYLVGAGPGRVDHLTVQASQLLQTCDVVIYDALINEDILALVSDQCVQVSVGKRGGQPSVSQSDINHLLVQYCYSHHRIVRLKSGDPFIFGRGMSEIQALREANCPYEIVPGISSALAAPLFAGIPLTDPVLSHGFSVVSAHQPDELNWDALVQMDTVVILMGTRQLETLVMTFLERGRSPQTPIAIIQWAGHPQQHIWQGTLETILTQTSRQSLSPAVIVIGEVVGLRSYVAPNTL
ncbi:MAG: uroporphyrinogen-III C-methyltransferase [Leptolyngbyaceae bacterium]|nr:uroporphyrinogen-III C-methyltransferase [Leptolyngbyaceae bacterium]